MKHSHHILVVTFNHATDKGTNYTSIKFRIIFCGSYPVLKYNEQIFSSNTFTDKAECTEV